MPLPAMHHRRAGIGFLLGAALLAGVHGSVSGAQGRVSPCPGCGFPPEPIEPGSHAGWTEIFDGQSLKGWDGNPAVWNVENGTITAASTAERRVGSTFLVWRGGEPGDFELKLEIKTDADIHSGVFYRGTVGPPAPRPAAARSQGTPPRPQPVFAVPADSKWNVVGYGLDFDYPLDNDGNVQDTSRQEPQIGWRGHVVRMETGQRPRAIAAIADRDALKAHLRQGDWNQLHIIARGRSLAHIVNGQLMAIVIDDDAAARTSGVIALQIEQYGTGRVSFRNIWLKQ